MLTSLHIFSFSHMLGLFDKLILPILTYGSEVSGFSKADNIEHTHLQFCKHLLGVKYKHQFCLWRTWKSPIEKLYVSISFSLLVQSYTV